MFQKDYWSKSDEELIALADKYHISRLHGYGAQETNIVNRDEVIEKLVARDSALRTRATVVLSIVSLIVSIVALCVSLRK